MFQYNDAYTYLHIYRKDECIAQYTHTHPASMIDFSLFCLCELYVQQAYTSPMVFLLIPNDMNICMCMPSVVFFLCMRASSQRRFASSASRSRKYDRVN
jgi:hypothetical protein